MRRHALIKLLSCLAFLGISLPGKAESSALRILVSEQVKVRFDSGDRLVTGMMARTKAYLDRSGLSYEMVYLPLGRTLQRAAEDDGALIFGIRRRPRKEEHYHWLLQLTEPLELALYARTGDPEAVKAGVPDKGLVACILRSFECEHMEDIGIASEALVAVPHTMPEQVERLLMSGRVRYMVQSPALVASNLGKVGHAPSDVRLVWQGETPAIYLGADKGANPALIGILQKVALDGLPPVAHD